LGSIVAPYLAGAGFGKITLVDADIPDLSNLHRQVFYSEGETLTKSQALANHIQKLNSEIEVLVVEDMLTKSNIDSIIKTGSIVVECTDDMMTKYLVNDYCHLKGVTMVYGAIYKFDGYVSLFENENKDSIHLRDAFPEPDLDVPSCSDVGVLNTIAGMIGLLQANEAIKYVLGVGQILSGSLLTYNALTNDQLKLKLKKNWKQDIEVVYKSTSYNSIHCINVPEISYEDLQKNRANFNVISILEDDEHQNIFDSVKRMPFSTFNTRDWNDKNKPTVFYCMSGKRSSVLVEKLISEKDDLSVYSLKGGLNHFLSKVYSDKGNKNS
jgi:adenylyltransferase/sulfurtransferase